MKRKREEDREGTEGETKGQDTLENVDVRRRKRSRVEPQVDPDHVTTWVLPYGHLHHHRPHTYPNEFFQAPPLLQSRFVLLNMSELYFDTRITNRALHNMTDVTAIFKIVGTCAVCVNSGCKIAPSEKAR